LAAEQLLYSLNMILTTATDVWALRYPETNELWILERTLGSMGEMTADTGITRVFSGQLAILPATVIASQPMDSNPDWRLLEPGELIHVDSDLNVSSQIVVREPPAKLMELNAQEAVAQAE
jgi:glutamine amidotransferase